MSEEPKRKWLNVRARLAIAAVIIATAIVVTLTTGRSNVPSFAGRSADDWLRTLAHPRSITDAEQERVHAISVFQQLGTNGTAFLVETLQRRDSPASKLYLRLLEALPNSVASRLPRITPASMKATWAAHVLSQIDDVQPEKTFPRIVKALTTTPPEGSPWVAGVIQSYLRKYPKIDAAQFRPQLVVALSNTNTDEGSLGAKLILVQALDQARLGGPELPAALLPLLTNSNPVIRTAGQQVLSKLSPTNTIALTNAP